MTAGTCYHVLALAFSGLREVPPWTTDALSDVRPTPQFRAHKCWHPIRVRFVVVLHQGSPLRSDTLATVSQPSGLVVCLNHGKQPGALSKPKPKMEPGRHPTNSSDR